MKAAIMARASAGVARRCAMKIDTHETDSFYDRTHA